jgi:hypothetical protein
METNKPRLDAIALKRRIQAEIYAETRHLTPSERLAYFKQQVENGPFQKLLATANKPSVPNVIESEHRS